MEYSWVYVAENNNLINCLIKILKNGLTGTYAVLDPPFFSPRCALSPGVVAAPVIEPEICEKKNGGVPLKAARFFETGVTSSSDLLRFAILLLCGVSRVKRF